MLVAPRVTLLVTLPTTPGHTSCHTPNHPRAHFWSHSQPPLGTLLVTLPTTPGHTSGHTTNHPGAHFWSHYQPPGAHFWSHYQPRSVTNRSCVKAQDGWQVGQARVRRDLKPPPPHTHTPLVLHTHHASPPLTTAPVLLHCCWDEFS